MDVVGLAGDIAHHDLRRRHVAVLGQAVVLAEPGVLPVVLVGEDRVLRLAHQLAVLPLGVVGARPRDVAVEEDAELHGASDDVCPPLDVVTGYDMHAPTDERQVVIVTGGSQGVGLGIARAFLNDGAAVVTCARTAVRRRPRGH